MRAFALGGLAIGVVAGGIALTLAPAMQRLELQTLDTRLSLRGDAQLDDRIVIVDVDDEMVALLGYPLARGYYGQVLDVAARNGARAVGFDVLFIDESVPEQDALLVKAAAACKCAIFPSQITFDANSGAVVNVQRPMKALDEVSAARAHVQLDNARDGVFRRVVTDVQHDGERFVPLGLAVANVGGAPVTPDLAEAALSTARAGQPGRADIGWRTARSGHMSTVRFLDVLEADEAVKSGQAAKLDLANTFAGKLVMIGQTAKDIGDRGAVPSSADAPLVLVHANFLDNIVEDRLMPPAPFPVAGVFVVLLSVIVAVSVASLSALPGVLVSAGAVALSLVNAQLAFSNAGLWLPVAAPLVGAGLAFLGASVFNVAVRDAGERRMKKLFSRYVAPHILEQILKSPESVDIRGHKRRITLLFSDIKGYTTLSNALPADEIVELLCAYLDTMVGILLQNSGTVDKIMGDGIMCFFGDPVPHEDHALRAVKAALAMQRAVDQIGAKLGPKWSARKLEPLQVRIGIATGEVFVGTIGSRDHLEYTAIGRPVNLASRLEGKAPPGGVLISRETWELVKNEVVCREVQGLDLKGYSMGYDAWQVLGLAGEVIEADASDQRKDARRAWFANATMTVGGAALEVRSTDISPGGMFVVCDTLPPAGTVVAVEASLARVGRVHIDAIVTHVREGKDGTGGVGLMFRSVFADDRTAIQALLAGVLGEEGFDERRIEGKAAGGFEYLIDADRPGARDAD